LKHWGQVMMAFCTPAASRAITFEGLFPQSWGLLCLKMYPLGILDQSPWSLGQFFLTF